jgi:hypothetical protein
MGAKKVRRVQKKITCVGWASPPGLTRAFLSQRRRPQGRACMRGLSPFDSQKLNWMDGDGVGLFSIQGFLVAPMSSLVLSERLLVNIFSIDDLLSILREFYILLDSPGSSTCIENS